MPSSLVKFANKIGSGHRKLFWHRADMDGAPFRGPFAPNLTEEEYEARTVRVADYRNNFFDVTDPAQNKLFLEVMECCVNGWFRLAHIERFWQGTTAHYVEWFEYYLEDGTRTPFMSSGMMELPNGQANVVGDLG